MSAGPGSSGVRPGPARAGTLARLQRELLYARDAHEDEYAAALEADIALLSQGSADNPRTETTGRPAARKQRTR